MCPRHYARWGAALLVSCLYFAINAPPVFSRLLVSALHGNFSPPVIVWAVLMAVGLVLLARGIREARTHADDFRFSSFAWSIAVIVLGGHYLLNNPATMPPPDWVRCVLFGWVAGNAVNIYLQLRGFAGRRSDLPDYLQPPRRSLFGFRRRSVTVTEWGYSGDNSQPVPDAGYSAPHVLPGHAPGLYIKQGDRFIPVQLGQAAPHVIEHRR